MKLQKHNRRKAVQQLEKKWKKQKIKESEEGMHGGIRRKCITKNKSFFSDEMGEKEKNLHNKL